MQHRTERARRTDGRRTSHALALAPSRAMSRRKLIIDTDPGVDDALAIFMAFNSPDVEVLGLTTIFGNVTTPMATANALHLCEMAKRTDVPVAQARSRPHKAAVHRRV